MPLAADISITSAGTAGDIADARRLMLDYAARLGVDLCFQGFDREMATLPGVYAPPRGAILLARDGGGSALGCVALRPLAEAGVCEMKRLYVAPAGRGRGVGRGLVEALLREADRIGYREMRLDTLPSMREALALYRDFGFEPCAAYYATPLAETVFLSRRLGA